MTWLFSSVTIGGSGKICGSGSNTGIWTGSGVTTTGCGWWTGDDFNGSIGAAADDVRLLMFTEPVFINDLRLEAVTRQAEISAMMVESVTLGESIKKIDTRCNITLNELLIPVFVEVLALSIETDVVSLSESTDNVKASNSKEKIVNLNK